MAFDRLFAEAQAAGDLAIGQRLPDHVQHILLARGQF